MLNDPRFTVEVSIKVPFHDVDAMWVMAYGATLAPGMRFCSIDSVKFQRPIVPGSELELNLQWDATRCVLSFTYTLLNEEGGVAASSGKIKLCP